MVRRLDMHKTQGIEHLFAIGMSKRKIARTLGIDRRSVDRHLADIHSKGAISQDTPIGETPTDPIHTVPSLTLRNATNLYATATLSKQNKCARGLYS